MKISTNIRNWGEGSDIETLLSAVQAAEAGGIDTVWVNDRLSTPSDAGWAPGDGGRYLDPILTLTFLAAHTERIGLGTGVINVPYRLPFQLVKQVATLQDLSAERLRLGVGVGWYEAEFNILGVPYRRRGKATDAALSLLHEAFSQDTVTFNDTTLPVLPRPNRPPIYVGGHSKAALERTVRFGDGWIAAGKMPEEIREGIAALDDIATAAGKARPYIIAMKTLPLENPEEAIALARGYANVGVDEIVHAGPYPDADAFHERVRCLTETVLPAVNT